MSKDGELKSEYSDLHRDYSSYWDPFLLWAQAYTEMHLGVHFSAKQVAAAKRINRTLYPFNDTHRQVDILSGLEIQDRHVIKIGPVGKEDDEAANQHTGIIMQQMAAGGHLMRSECFKWGSLVSGSNLLDIYNDREGVRRFARRPYNSFLLDPSFRNPDLSDCRNILTGQWLHEDTVKMLLPEKADSIDKIPSSTGMRWRDTPDTARQEYTRLYEEWWGLETGFENTVINRLTGQQMKLKDFQAHPDVGGAAAATDIIDNMRSPRGGPVWSKFQKPYKRVFLRIFVDDELVFNGYNPTKLDEYNFVWFAGEWCPEALQPEAALRSITGRLYWPQTARDKRLNQLLDIIENSIQSAKAVKTDSLENDDDAYKTGQTGPIWIKKNFPGSAADAIHQMAGPNVPAGIFQAIDLLDKQENRAVGLNDAILGDDNSKDIPALLDEYRTSKAVLGQGGIFQSFRFSSSQMGRKMVKMNQIWKSPKAVMRHLNERPAPGFYKPDFTRFDSFSIQGLLTESQRQLNFIQLRELYKMFPDKIPASLVIQAVPVQQPKELIQAVKSQEQQQSQMMQQQLQTKTIMEKMMMAQAELDMAKARGEITDATYDRAKTLVEMQKIQGEPQLGLIDRYLKYIELMEQSKQAQIQARQGAGATR